MDLQIQLTLHYHHHYLLTHKPLLPGERDDYPKHVYQLHHSTGVHLHHRPSPPMKSHYSHQAPTSNSSSSPRASPPTFARAGKSTAQTTGKGKTSVVRNYVNKSDPSNPSSQGYSTHLQSSLLPAPRIAPPTTIPIHSTFATHPLQEEEHQNRLLDLRPRIWSRSWERMGPRGGRGGARQLV